MQLTVATTYEKLQESLASYALSGKRVALVPTMGALHEGHASLIRLAKSVAEEVVVSIFVNPKQFGAGEDFSIYPRMLNDDIKVVSEAGGRLVYAPSVEDIYPAGFATQLRVGGLTDRLCGASRPGHFDGVATVVAELLLRVLPHVAVFGEKDYQQLCVIQRLVQDLDLGVDIIAAPTWREEDGLPLSSRNRYLSAEERLLAPKLYAALRAVNAKMGKEGARVQDALQMGIDALEKIGFHVEYLELCDAETLAPLLDYMAGARLLVAARLGKTRLIDNLEVGND